MVVLVAVVRDCVIVSLALSGWCLASSCLPAPFSVSVLVLVLPAGIVAVSEAIVIVFVVVFLLVVLVDAATAITLPPRIVSSTEAVSVILQEVLPVQLTRTVIVAPEVLMCSTLARALMIMRGLTVASGGVVGVIGGGVVAVIGGGVVAVISVDWPLLAR